jgi:hypothetical protein
MPSFDVVSRLNIQEVTNAYDQAQRELSNRFDFKGTNATYERKDNVITLRAPSEFQLKQMIEILYGKLAKRGIDLKCAQAGEPQVSLSEARQTVTLREGIDADNARHIVKLVKESKLKVQAAIQDQQVRVTGKKRDDLQEAIALLRGAELELPLQYVNFRD